jgi:hypothetical protein
VARGRSNSASARIRIVNHASHHGNLKEALLRAALELIRPERTGGFQLASIPELHEAGDRSFAVLRGASETLCAQMPRSRYCPYKTHGQLNALFFYVAISVKLTDVSPYVVDLLLVLEAREDHFGVGNLGGGSLYVLLECRFIPNDSRALVRI